jgi:hypothetical protein
MAFENFEYVDCDEKKKIVEPTVENRRSAHSSIHKRIIIISETHNGTQREYQQQKGVSLI